MGFSRLGAAFYTMTVHEGTQSKLNDVHHAWHGVLIAGQSIPEASMVDCTSQVIK